MLHHDIPANSAVLSSTLLGAHTRRRVDAPPIVTRLISAVLLTLGLLCVPAVEAAVQAVAIGNWCNEPVRQPCDAAFRIDLATGQRALVSALTQQDVQAVIAERLNGTGSATARNRGGSVWTDVSIAPFGRIFVLTRSGLDDSAGVYAVAPNSGARVLLSPMADPNYGPALDVNYVLTRLETTATGQLLAWDGSDPTRPIVSIDPVSGDRVAFSNPIQPTQGYPFNAFFGSTPDKRLIASNAGLRAYESLLQINPVTGTRNLIAQAPPSNAGYSCGLGVGKGIVDSENRLYCIDRQNGTDGYYTLEVINTLAGTPRTVLSDFGDSRQGPNIDFATDAAWGPTGNILLLGWGLVGNKVNYGLFSIDPDTGLRTLLSDFLSQTQGPPIYNAGAFAVGALPESRDKGGRPILLQSDTSEPAQVGDTYAYTISFTNFKRFDLTNVKLTSRIPRKTKFSAVSTSQGHCKGRRTVMCRFGTVAPGATVMANITVIAKKSGISKNKVWVTYKTPKPGAKEKVRHKLFSIEKTQTTQRGTIHP